METAAYYILSTIPQVLAAAAALIGVLVLFRIEAFDRQKTDLLGRISSNWRHVDDLKNRIRKEDKEILDERDHALNISDTERVEEIYISIGKNARLEPVTSETVFHRQTQFLKIIRSQRKQLLSDLLYAMATSGLVIVTTVVSIPFVPSIPEAITLIWLLTTAIAFTVALISLGLIVRASFRTASNVKKHNDAE